MVKLKMLKTPKDLTEKGFEEYIEFYFLNSGYVKGNIDNYNKNNAIDTKILFDFLECTQPEKLKKLKEIYRDQYKEKILSRFCSELDSENRGTIDVLRHQVRDYGVYLDLAYFKPASKLNKEALERYNKNIFSIYRQVEYSSKHKKTIDMLICLNGLPIAVFELKNQLTNQSCLDGIKQFQTDRDPREILFQFKKRAIVFFAVDTDDVYMTTKLAGEKTFFLPFNKGDNGGKGNPVNPNGYRTAYLWEDILEKDSLLNILHKFVYILKEETKNEKGEKIEKETLIFPRYHQLDAVRKLEEDAKKNGPGKKYLIQHSAGSGKTLSISWLAYRLANLHNEKDLSVFDSVIVITDRKVLDKQLQDSIYQLEHKPGVVQKIDEDSKQLAEAVKSKIRIVISTIQKYAFILDKVDENKYNNYAIIIDEAHSSFSGSYLESLELVLAEKTLEEATKIDEKAEKESKDVEDVITETIKKFHPQKNLSFFAFTATPKSKTIEMFGLKDEFGNPLGKPFHLYSMRQAIEEGFILDVLQNYVTYQTYYKLGKKIEEDPLYNKSKTVKALARFVSLHPNSIEQKTEIMIEHFQNITRHKIGGRAKAIVVTSSRLHALRYKFAFDNYIKKKGYTGLKTLVAFSGTVKDGGVEYTEKEINKIKELELPDKFASNEYQVLIVAEKYQTGYDQPLLHTMFVDKKLWGLKAVQTLSRINRTCNGKDDTFILDFVNKAEDIQDAFRPYYETTILENFTDPNLLYDLQTKLNETRIYLQEEIDKFIALFLTPEDKKQLKDRTSMNRYIDESVERFKRLTEEEKENFKSNATKYTRLYSFILQITYFTDTNLHKLHLYLSFLLKKLPKKETEKNLNLTDEVALEYYKNEKIFEGNLALKPTGEPESLGPVVGGGVKKKDDEKAPLSSIIERLNARFGTNFTEADRLSVEQIKEDFASNKELIEKAKVNAIEDFKYAYNKAFNDIVINRREQNEVFFKKIINDEEFKNVFMGYLLPEIYEKLKIK